MRMSAAVRCVSFLIIVGTLGIVVALSGCHRPVAEKEPGKKQPSAAHDAAKKKAESQEKDLAATEKGEENVPAAKSKSKPSEEDLMEEQGTTTEKPRDLGPPLVDDPQQLVRLHPEQLVWVDRQNKHVVLQGEVCRAGYPLEFFATYSNRSYEAAIAVNVKPSIVHAGLLAVGAVPGHPAQFQPRFVPPTGTEIAIDVRWKDAHGRVKTEPAQEWIRNIKTRKPLDQNWVFAGSAFVTDEATGKKYYQADSGELICVLSLPNAMLDLPTRGYGALEDRSFEAFEEHLPPPGTPVTLVLKPILPVKTAGFAMSGEKLAEAEKKAIEAAEAWLALTDQSQYSHSWETSADRLKKVVERRDFVKSLNAVRKPLGEVKSRVLESKKYVTSMPGAPDGHYIMLQYKTSFEKKASAVETITPMLDKDKKWKVSGYYIK